MFSCTQADAIDHFNRISAFLAQDYIDLISVHQGKEIYSNHLQDIPEEDLGKSQLKSERSLFAHEFQRSEHDVTAWTEEANRINLSGFDHVNLFSEDAINALFRARWSGAQGRRADNLYTWVEQSFKANFGQITTQLLSGDRAIVFVKINKASMSLNNRYVRKTYYTMGEF